MLGNQTMKILETNQRRPLTTLDLQLQRLPIARVWNAIEDLISQCEGSDEKYEENCQRHKWLAELALGTLNNLIQKQFSEGWKNVELFQKWYFVN